MQNMHILQLTQTRSARRTLGNESINIVWLRIRQQTKAFNNTSKILLLLKTSSSSSENVLIAF